MQCITKLDYRFHFTSQQRKNVKLFIDTSISEFFSYVAIPRTGCFFLSQFSPYLREQCSTVAAAGREVEPTKCTTASVSMLAGGETIGR